MVLASDSRGTFGDPRAVTAQNDNMKKLYLVSKHVGVILAGSGELGYGDERDFREDSFVQD
jgi:hypothetical protein